MSLGTGSDTDTEYEHMVCFFNAMLCVLLWSPLLVWSSQKFTYVTSATHLGSNSLLCCPQSCAGTRGLYTVLTLGKKEGMRVMLNVFGMSDFKTGHIARV